MPVVWVIEPYRAGERNQVLALADALGWPYEVKRLSYRKYEFLTNIFRGSDLRGINSAESDDLQGPWPDLVISSGMRNEAVCRWIQLQSDKHCKIVHVGNPWADPRRFDLVVTTPQYRIPERENVLQNALTLNSVTQLSLDDEAQQWQAQFKHLPRPYTVIVLGGDSGPYTLGVKAAARLARQVNSIHRQRGGSVLVTTSSRTAKDAADLLEAKLDRSDFFYRWRPDDADNPYQGLLALADYLIVTADSISMLSEACATGKPLAMFDLGVAPYGMGSPEPGGIMDNDWRLGGVMYRLLMRFVWQKLSRDIRLVHGRILRDGRAAWLGQDLPAGREVGNKDLPAAVAAVRSLFGDDLI